MIFPVIYAVLVWYLAAKYRRRWRGALSVLAGLGLLAVIGLMALEHEHPWPLLGRSTSMPEWWRQGSKQLLVLLLPYTALVGTVAVFLFSLPRPHAPIGRCKRCGYSLEGLNPLGVVCPECGHEHGPFHCASCGFDLRGHDPLHLHCPQCSAPWKGAGSGRESDSVELTPIPKQPVKRRRSV